jgi:nucleoside-diphosphate-sugar epimerase
MSEKKDKSCLLTGASGFIGGFLIGKLISNGWNVHCVIRKKSSIKYQDKVIYHFYDESIESVIDAFSKSKPKIVFHLASLFIVNHKPNDITHLIDSNIKYGSYILEAMKLSKCSNLINVGSSWQNYNKDEYNPVNLYASTKEAYEKIIKFYVEAYSFNVITLRIFDTYGFGDKRNKVLNLLLNQLGTLTPLKMSPGAQKINLVHVSDVAEAFIIAANRLLKRSKNKNEVFSIKSEVEYSLKDLVLLINNINNIELKIEWGGLDYRDREVMEPLCLYPSLPNWKPKVNLCDGLKYFFEESLSEQK